ncbi:hypothetical protein CORC01_00118 [Colletotrichum orchidophilum]|uniref:Uncharacterized protein n=1 Tax=Colletotrichum orchidophilum TaxID=1209926 RepID=A0A1G4BTR5_9PEZI|nr:uncharacterized protein CORC01_00118 [Colletotrichum orchidophilum]OHF04647.1 hypothetical protein CORC01_00118 [Colletotrichum orchidophilum]
MSRSAKKATVPQERYNPLIKPTDEAWIAALNQFKELLSLPTLRTEQVLEEYFTPHERKLFMPATEPRSLRDCQEDYTRRYRNLVTSRFKGCQPSLAMKFTMLYFGLPVEPVLSELVQFAKPDFDVDDWDELCNTEVRPPLHFLTAHDQRNFGYDHMRGREAQYSTIPVPASQMSDATGEGLSLRGGGNDDDARMEDADCPPSDDANRNTGLYDTATTLGKQDDDFSDDSFSGGTMTLPGLGISSKAIPGRQPTSSMNTPERPDIHEERAGFSYPTPDPKRLQTQSTVASRTESQAAEPYKAHGWIPLYGYQGRIMFDPDEMSTFQAAARKLLSLRQREQSDLVLVEFDRTTAKIVRQFEDNIPLNPVSDLAKHLGQTTESESNSAWFVLRRGEAMPAEWEPPKSFFSTTLIRLSHTDEGGRKNFSYCKVPNRKRFFGPKISGFTHPSMRPWGANQFMPFLTTAQEVLVGRPDRPGGGHCDLVISSGDDNDEVYSSRWYGGLEIHRNLWNMMHPFISKGKAFKVETHPFADKSVVFYLPGNLNNAITLKNRECLRRTGSGDPYPDALRQVGAITSSIKMPMEPSHYLIWRGIDYFNPLVSYPVGTYDPVRWNHLDQDSSEHAQQALSRLIARSVDNQSEPCQFFVIQPVDKPEEPCVIETIDGQTGQATFNMEPHTMHKLKSKVRTLYDGDNEVDYDAERDSIIIESIFDEDKNESANWTPTSFVLRPEAADSEVAMVRRLLLAQLMQVGVLKNEDDELDFVKSVVEATETNNHWGPRYGEVTPFRRELSLPAIVAPGQLHSVVFHKPQTPPPLPRAARQSPRAPEQPPRERSYVQQPSIFDKGIWNPSFPINAPPVEAVMRTGGGRVPMVTKNVLTPTEQRQLQDKLWNLSKIKLARLFPCPYQKCRFTHRQDEEEKLLEHLEKTHVGEKCPWCDTQLFKHWSHKQKEEHYINTHADQLRKVLQLPETPSTRPLVAQKAIPERLRYKPATTATSLSTFRITEQARPPVGPLPRPEQPSKASDREVDYRYCDRCGRDHTELDNPDDREHHDRVCVPLAEGSGQCTFCRLCGDREWKTEKDASDHAPFDTYPHKCHGTLHEAKPHCTKCGFSMKKVSAEDIDKHRSHCRGFYGTLGCFCPYCQKSAVGDGKRKSADDIKKHITECPAKEGDKPTPYEIYPEAFWKDIDASVDPLFVGAQGTSAALLRRQHRPRGPARFLSFPLMWYDKPGPMPAQDPPSECPAAGCREPLFGLTPSEVLGHFEKKHDGEPLRHCPLCHLTFRRPKEYRENKPELGEWEDRKDQVSHMECHVYQLWDILNNRGPPPAFVNQEPFNPGHSLWDPENESALDRRDKRCPHFDKCGAMVGFMNQRQWNEHVKMAHATENFETEMVRDTNAEFAAAREERRKQRILEGKQPIPGQLRPKHTQDGEPGAPTTGRRSTVTVTSVQPDDRPPSRRNREDDQGPENHGPEIPLSRGVRLRVTSPQDGPAGGSTPEGTIRGNSDHGDNCTSESRSMIAPPPTVPRPSAATTSEKYLRQVEKPSKAKETHTTKLSKKPTSTQKRPVTTKTNHTPKSKANTTPAAKFVPDENMYCSRCFRKAPKKKAKRPRQDDPPRQEQIDAHSDPRRSCRIPPRESYYRVDSQKNPILPSRVGWIRKRNAKFGDLRRAFIKDNPDLEKTMCPTDNSKNRTGNGWPWDPNNPINRDSWGLVWRGRKGDGSYGNDDDGEGDYIQGEEQTEDEDEEMDSGVDDDEEEEDGGEAENEGGSEEAGEDDDDDNDDDEQDRRVGAGGDSGTRPKRKRKSYRGFLTHDPTYRDRGEEDDLSQASPSELVSESGDEGAGGASGSSGGKRKRETGETTGQGSKGVKYQTQERNRKKTKVADNARGR